MALIGMTEKDQLETRKAIARAIFDSLCPSVRWSPVDEQSYLKATDAALKALEAAKHEVERKRSLRELVRNYEP